MLSIVCPDGFPFAIRVPVRVDPAQRWIRIEGELWQAASGLPLSQSQTVKVVGREGLTLEVVPVDPSQ